VDLVALPGDLRNENLDGRIVVVFDVLRATTTIAAALAAGVSEIRVFGDIELARAAAEAHVGARLLCGEVRCLPPPGFDLGNSPGAFEAARHRGRVVFMSTTNGTRAIIAATSAAMLLSGALVDAAAVARLLAAASEPITLLCAGTDGQAAPEDVLGAGAVLEHLLAMSPGAIAPTAKADEARTAFAAARDDLTGALRRTQGGRNVIAAGLDADVAFAARLDVMGAVGRVAQGPLRVLPQASGASSGVLQISGP
jgi:2-phosphosulfolactate phosphatase